jgi:tetratricopeptide (TPR) repeat protein
VDALVEGSVQRSNGTVLINVELVDASSDHQLWARSYQRATTDFLSLQNEVAQAIASEIKVKMTSQEQARMNAPRPVRPEAQEAYLRGIYWQDKADPKKFYEYMQQAIQKDPRYALAFSDAYGVMIYSGMIPEKEAYPKWRDAVATALELDDNLAEAHRASAALLLYHDYKWSDAEREFRRALELNPNLVDAHLWLADGLVAVGRLDEAVVEARRAVQLNPYSVLANSRLAQNLFFARRFDEAVDVSRGMLELAPGYGHWVIGLVNEQKGDLNSAITEYQEAIKFAGGNPDLKTWVPASLGHAYAIAGKKAEALRIVSELTELSSLIRVDPGVFAIVYAGLGDKDRAFEWLTKGYDDRPSTAMRIKVEPRLESLHSDPRFDDFVKKMGLES